MQTTTEYVYAFVDKSRVIGCLLDVAYDQEAKIGGMPITREMVESELRNLVRCYADQVIDECVGGVTAVRTALKYEPEVSA